MGPDPTLSDPIDQTSDSTDQTSDSTDQTSDLTDQTSDSIDKSIVIISIDSTLIPEVPIPPVTSRQLVEVIVRSRVVVSRSENRRWKVYLWARNVSDIVDWVRKVIYLVTDAPVQ
jgi:hypothetical protein